MSPDSNHIRNVPDVSPRFRMVILIGALMFLLIFVISFFIVSHNGTAMRDRINRDFNQQQLILARQAASRLSEILRDVASEIEGLSHIIEETRGNTPLSNTLRAALTHTVLKDVIEIRIVDADGHSIAGCALDDTITLLPEELALTISEHDVRDIQMSDLTVRPAEDGPPVITGLFYAKVNLGEEKKGLLFMNVNVTRLVANVAQSLRSGKQGYAWVINERGVFLYHPERAFIGKDAFAVREERNPSINFEKINTIMKEKMLRGEEGTDTYESGWHRDVKGRITKLIAFSPIQSAALGPHRVWSIAVVAPLNEVAEAVHSVYTQQYVAQLAILIGVFVVGMLIVFSQLRITKTLRNRVIHQEKYLSSVLQNTVDAIIFIDNDNRVQLWNSGAELIFGYTAEEMIGQTFHRLIPPDMDADKELGAIRYKVIKNGFIRNYRAPRWTKDGRRITIDLSRTLIRSDEGAIIGSAAIIRDVTKEVEMGQRMYHTEKLASIGNLAAGVAHEINNPLAIILGFTDLLLERYPPDSREYSDLKMIEENANNAKKIVETLLEFARVSEGLEDNIDVNKSIDMVIAVAENTLIPDHIELKVDISPNLPLVRGDPREFQQVLFNLINNSVAAMEKKGGVLTISARVENEWIYINVTDTGTGVPDKIKSRIFDPFFTTKNVGEGTGLGLSLCYGIVKKFGGNISFTSTPEEDSPGKPIGTSFTVSLPVYKPEERPKGGVP